MTQSRQGWLAYGLFAKARHQATPAEIPAILKRARDAALRARQLGNTWPLLDELLSLFDGRFQSKDLQIEKDYDQCQVVTAVRGEIRQIFANLLVNAIDASPHGGKLRIQVAGSGENVIIQFADDGPGVPDKDVEKIFEPFFTTKKDVGTGLGLWVAKDLAVRHGGEVHLAKDKSRQGACFEVKLPNVAVAEGLSVQVGQ